MTHIFETPANGSDLWRLGAEDGAACALRIVGGVRDDKHYRVFTAPYDRLFYVLQGTVTVVLGAKEISVCKDRLVRIPPNVSFGYRGGSKDLAVLEIAVPGGANLDSLLSESEPKEHENVERLVISVEDSKFTKGGFSNQALLSRDTGFDKLKFSVFQVQPGAGSPDFHIHAFDQYYVILDGVMTIDIGRNRFTARKHNLVSLPAGLVHRNFNVGPSVERHITLLVPEPKPGAIFDYAVEIHNREAVRLTVIPENPQ